jgi:ribosomal protein L7/L12
MKNDDRLSALAGKIMAEVIGAPDGVGDRIMVGDLWTIVETTVRVVTDDARENGVIQLSDTERVRRSRQVRDFIIADKKIQAIKEARMISGMSLKESKDVVEAMQIEYQAAKKSGGAIW